MKGLILAVALIGCVQSAKLDNLRYLPPDNRPNIPTEDQGLLAPKSYVQGSQPAARQSQTLTGYSSNGGISSSGCGSSSGSSGPCSASSPSGVQKPAPAPAASNSFGGFSKPFANPSHNEQVAVPSSPEIGTGFSGSPHFAQNGPSANNFGSGQHAASYESSQQPLANSQYKYQSAPQNHIPIIKLDTQNNGDGSYSTDYETANGIQAQEQGQAQANGEVVQGSFSYTSPEGEKIGVSYTADESGYHPQGDNIPTPPPVPEAILKSIEYNKAHPEEESNDGSYSGDGEIQHSQYSGSSNQYLAPQQPSGRGNNYESSFKKSNSGSSNYPSGSSSGSYSSSSSSNYASPTSESFGASSLPSSQFASSTFSGQNQQSALSSSNVQAQAPGNTVPSFQRPNGFRSNQASPSTSNLNAFSHSSATGPQKVQYSGPSAFQNTRPVQPVSSTSSGGFGQLGYQYNIPSIPIGASGSSQSNQGSFQGPTSGPNHSTAFSTTTSIQGAFGKSSQPAYQPSFSQNSPASNAFQSSTSSPSIHGSGFSTTLDNQGSSELSYQQNAPSASYGNPHISQSDKISQPAANQVVTGYSSTGESGLIGCGSSESCGESSFNCASDSFSPCHSGQAPASSGAIRGFSKPIAAPSSSGYNGQASSSEFSTGPSSHVSSFSTQNSRPSTTFGNSGSAQPTSVDHGAQGAGEFGPGFSAAHANPLTVPGVQAQDQNGGYLY